MRTLGVIAGLASGAMALGLAALLALVGSVSAGSAAGSAGSDVGCGIGSVLIVGFAMLVGWLVEPSIQGTVRDDVAVGTSYVITACLLYLAIGTIGSAWTEVAGGTLHDAIEVVFAIVFRFMYGLLYAPLLALVVAPFAVAWVITIRLLRPRIRA